MLVDLQSYIVYMLRVYGVMIALLFVIPLSMWKVYLKDKSPGEKFMFCLITQTAFLVNIVLLLGFLDICTPVTLLLSIAAEYCLIRWTFSDRQFFKRRRADIQLIWEVIQHRKTKHYLLRVFLGGLVSLGRKMRKSAAAIWKTIRSHWGEVLFLTVVCIYNILFLTRNLYIYHSYQVSDTSVHLSWVYGLEYESLFIDGIYPFFMHSMLYVVWALSAIPLREVVLYLGAFMSVMLILCLYLLAKRFFGWKYTSWLVLILLSVLLNEDRYGASLPQECGIFAMAGMAYYLIGCFRDVRKKHLVPGDGGFRRIFRINQYLTRKSLNLNFWLLSLCVSLVIGFHFYTAIAAIVMALAIVMAHAAKFFRKQYFVPIICAALTGAMITIVPYGACLAKGIPFQGSMDWAMSVIKGEEWSGTGAGYAESINMAAEPEEEEEEILPIYQRNDSVSGLVLDYIEQLRIFSDTYVLGLAKIENSIITPYTAVCIVLGLLAAVLFYLSPKTRHLTTFYFSIVFNLVGIATVGSFLMMGLMVLIDPSRASVFTKPFLFLVMALPFDILFVLLSNLCGRAWRRGLAVVSLVCYGAAGGMMIRHGYLHEYFAANIPYYNEPDFLIYRIQEEFPDFSYTILSPTDEYYAVVERGYHTELSEFIAMAEGNVPYFTLPTEYNFFFVEKHTLTGYYSAQNADISQDFARQEFIYRADLLDYQYQRNVLESKAYYWARAMEEIYPNQMSVFFENDIYICFVLRQDTNCPLDMRIDYLSFMEEDES